MPGFGWSIEQSFSAAVEPTMYLTTMEFKLNRLMSAQVDASASWVIENKMIILFQQSQLADPLVSCLVLFGDGHMESL